MDFIVSTKVSVKADSDYTCQLIPNSWDDFGFRTTFECFLCRLSGEKIKLGHLRIAKQGMASGTPVLDNMFTSLDDGYFSVGGDENYYKMIGELPEDVSKEYLAGIRDIVSNPLLQEVYASEPVMTKSLMRFTSMADVRVNYRLALTGHARPQAYSFVFQMDGSSSELSFDVDPNTMPPSNIHVLIGRNGVGKTRLLAGMVDSLTDSHTETIGIKGKFKFNSPFPQLPTPPAMTSEFLNLVVVSFSAFDRFMPMDERSHRGVSTVPYNYVGLRKSAIEYSDQDKHKLTLKTLDELASEFESSLMNVLAIQKTSRLWKEALATLQIDPQIAEFCKVNATGEDWKSRGEMAREFTDLFEQMSAGHKIVFLTLARLVECVRDQSFVIIDEPETHLHPPLLGSLVRALSDLMKKRNAVALIATHSPVVLQEVPSSCVQVISRSGEEIVIRRPEDQTFAENVSVLTRRVFNLELTNSGFYALLCGAAKIRDFEEVIEDFDNQVGSEGRALLRSFTAQKS